MAEAGAEPVGSWPGFYDSLTLFSPARHSALPGMGFDGDPGRYLPRDEVVDYLRRYAARLDADIRTRTPVTSILMQGNRFVASAGDGEVHARRVVSATGAFTQPYRPMLPGLETFTGTVLHSAEYRAPVPFVDRQVMVVGGGNSAVQIATELASVATVTLTSRRSLRLLPQRPLGRDIHDWLAWTGLGHGRASRLLARDGAAALDDGRHRAALRAGNPRWRPLFERIDGDHVMWPDGSKDSVQAIVLATGYRPEVSHLQDLRGALDNAGLPVHRHGVSTTVPGLGFVGLEWQRGFASATLRGVGPDAAYVLASPAMRSLRGRSAGR